MHNLCFHPGLWRSWPGHGALIQIAPLGDVRINSTRTPQQRCCSTRQRYNAVQCAAEVAVDDFEIVCVASERSQSLGHKGIR